MQVTNIDYACVRVRTSACVCLRVPTRAYVCRRVRTKRVILREASSLRWHLDAAQRTSCDDVDGVDGIEKYTAVS